MMLIARHLLFSSYSMIVRFTVGLLFIISTSAVSTAAVVIDSLTYAHSFADTSNKDNTLSADIDLKSQPGSIILALGDTKNLGSIARFSTVYLGSFPPSAADPTKPDTGKINGNNLGDNNYFTIVEFPAGPTANNGSYIKIDLRSVRQIKSVSIVNIGNFATSYRNRARAFSLYSGLDSNSLSRVYQETDNVDTTVSKYVMNIADVRPVRYLRLALDRVDVSQATVISELEIFGDGYVPEGMYVSKVDSFAAGAANFGRLYLDADFESGAAVSVQVRTGTKRTVDSLSWSGWSDPVYFSSTAQGAAGADLNLKEPRRYFQYRINLMTSNVGTPKVRGISFTYQHTLLADSAKAQVTPQEIPAFERTTLTYSIDARMSAGSLGFDTLKIYTPAPSIVDRVTINGSPVSYSVQNLPDRMIVAFASTVTTSSLVDVVFTTRMIANGNFPSQLINKNSAWNPQNVDPQITAGAESWRINTSGISQSSLVKVRIDPNPFTPNGDGKNDLAIIDFAVSNIEVPRTLRIHIFDLSGRKIRTVIERMTGISPYYGDPRFGGSGIAWDGKDDNGKVVPPGVYLVQVSLDVNNGGEFITKTVVVAY